MSDELQHIIYVSSATKALDDSEIANILETSRKNNAQLGVTGMLLYVDSTFFQIIEGPKPILENLYDKISTDPRHIRLSKLIQEDIDTRNFAEWTMGYASLTRKEYSQIDGVNDFFLSGNCFDSLNEGRARKIMASFKEWVWRNRIG